MYIIIAGMHDYNIGRYKDEAHYKCIEGYMVEKRTDLMSDISEDDLYITLLEYTFTCGANNDWTDAFSPQQCIKQNCRDPGKSALNFTSLQYLPPNPKQRSRPNLNTHLIPLSTLQDYRFHARNPSMDFILCFCSNLVLHKR